MCVCVYVCGCVGVYVCVCMRVCVCMASRCIRYILFAKRNFKPEITNVDTDRFVV